MTPSYPLSRRFIALYLLALLCLAAYMRIAGAGEYHLSPDEIMHFEIARGNSLADVIRRSLFETHPPLGNIIRHYWDNDSDAPWVLRSLSLVSGLALIALYYCIGARLAGPWAGITCASLIAFSHGCIIQSFVMRNYIFFLLFLSLALYAYLLWRQRHAPYLLALYMALGCCAVLTHFSGLPAIFCIAVTESYFLLRPPSNWRRLLAWALVNLAIIAVGLAALNFWLPLLDHTHAQVMRSIGTPRDWFYPVFAIEYFFAYHLSSAYGFALFALFTYALGISARDIPAARPYVLLAIVSLAVGSELVIGGFYYAGINRHSLWLMPLIVLPVGCALALLCQKLQRFAPATAIAAGILLLGWGIYDPRMRYADVSEYMMKENAWKEYAGYISSLDATHLVIASRQDAFLLAYAVAGNPYDLYALPRGDAKGTFSEANQTVFLPYRNTHILFKPYYLPYTQYDIGQFIWEANKAGKLYGINTLVFPSTLWSRDGIINFIQCTKLDKEVLFFPQSSGKDTLSYDEFDTAPAIVLEVPKEAFIEEMLRPGGKARGCLKGRFD